MLFIILSVILYLGALFFLIGFRMEKTAAVLLCVSGLCAVICGLDRLLCAALMLFAMFLYLIPVRRGRRR